MKKEMVLLALLTSFMLMSTPFASVQMHVVKSKNIADSGTIRAMTSSSKQPPNPTVAMNDIRGLSVGTHSEQNVTAVRKNFTLLSSDHNATEGGDYITARAKENVNATWGWKDYLYPEYNNTNMGQWSSGTLPGALKHNDNTNYTISAYNTTGDLHWAINASIALNISDYAGLTEGPLENLTINLRAKTTISTDTEHIMRIRGAEGSDSDTVVDSTSETVYNVTVSPGDQYVTDSGIVNITFKYDDSTDSDYSLKIDSLNVEPGFNSTLPDYSYEPAVTPVNFTDIEFNGVGTTNYTIAGSNVSMDLGSGNFFYESDDYDYGEWGIFSFAYQYNITVDTLDFRQKVDSVSIEQDQWTKDLDFTLNSSFSNLASMNWTIVASHGLKSRFTGYKVLNSSSNTWEAITDVESAKIQSNGHILMNVTNKATKESSIKVTIKDVAMPTFEDELSGVTWKGDEKLSPGQRNRTYAVQNNEDFVLENLTWSTSIPDAAVVGVTNAKSTSSLEIPSLGGGAKTEVEAQYRAAAGIVVEAYNKLWSYKRPFSGGSIVTTGPGKKQFGKGKFDNGEYELRTLPPGDYQVKVTAKGNDQTKRITLDYNEVAKISLTYTAWWVVGLIIGTIAAVIASIAVVYMYKKKKGKIGTGGYRFPF